MRDLDHEIAQVLAQLSICSEVAAASLGSSARASEDDIGGRRPPGGEDHKGNRDPEWALKSAEHFRRRLARAHSERTLTAILADAEAALTAWRRQPASTKDNEPEYGSPQWKRYIAESKESHGTLADRFHVERSYIAKIRRQYRIEVVA